MSSEHAIVHDQFDAATYEETRGMYPRLAHDTEQWADNVPQATPLAQDMFLSFHQTSPALADAGDVAPQYRHNRAMVEQMMSTREWGDLRTAGTIGNELTSAMATVGIAGKLLYQLTPDEVAQMKEQAEQTQRAEQLLDDASALDDAAREFASDALRAEAEQRRQDAQQAQQAADAAGAALDATADERGDRIRRWARVALAEQEREMQAMEAAFAAFGCGSEAGSGAGGANVQDKLKIAAALRANPRLAKLAQIVGRYLTSALAKQETHVEHQPSEITSVTQGDDLGHLLPTELALLGDSDLEDLFYQRFAEKRLMQYELQGNDKTGRGPIIVARDESGSMRAGMGGDTSRDLWAAAVSLALLAVAKKERRDFAIIHFGSYSELQVTTIARGDATPAQALALADHFYGGGTDYEYWMQHAIALTEGAQFDKADVVLISDGLSNPRDTTIAQFNQQRKQRQMRCYAVLLGAQSQPGDVVSQIADHVYALDDIAGEDTALDALFTL